LASNHCHHRFDEKRGITPRFFVATPLPLRGARPSRFPRRVLYDFGMVLDSTSKACRRVVIDDRSRLPGRFFGRFATSATSELSSAH
jgi:hypothetical protein